MLKHSWVLKAQSFLHEVRRSTSWFFVGCCICVHDGRSMLSLEGVMWLLHDGKSMLSLSGCSCFIVFYAKLLLLLICLC